MLQSRAFWRHCHTQAAHEYPHQAPSLRNYTALKGAAVARVLTARASAQWATVRARFTLPSGRCRTRTSTVHGRLHVTLHYGSVINRHQQAERRLRQRSIEPCPSSSVGGFTYARMSLGAVARPEDLRLEKRVPNDVDDAGPLRQHHQQHSGLVFPI